MEQAATQQSAGQRPDVAGMPGDASDEWDIPLGGLPGLARVQLGRTHVEAAVAEVRFVGGQHQLPEAAAAEVWEGLGPDAFPVFEPSTQTIMTFTITPNGPVPTQESQQGWLLATSDRSTAVTLLPSLVVVQTRDYQRYSTSLGGLLARVLELFTAATGVSRIQRLGLRYVNRLTDPAATTPQFWREHIRDPFAGPLRSPLATLVTGVHQQVQLKLDATAGARVQSGVFAEQQPGVAPTEQRYSYLVDLDVFREQALAYDATTCANQVRQLNRTALALFASVLSDQYLAELGPTAAPATGGAAEHEAVTVHDDDLTQEGESPQ